MSHKFDVSVITPCFGETEAMLRRNLISVSEQDTKYSVQHIIILDGGKPETALALRTLTAELELHKKMDDNRVVIIISNKNVGLPNARNIAMNEATGEFTMFLDADDCFAPNRVENQLDWMKVNNLDHCYGGYQEVLGEALLPQRDAPIIIPSLDSAQELKKGVNPCYCGSNCVRTKVFEEVGKFDGSMLDGAEDMEMWLRISLSPEEFKVGCLPQVLYYLGVHGENMTAKYLKEGRFEKAYDYIQKKHSLTFNQ